MKYIILLVMIATTLPSCKEVLDLKHDNSEPILVVEGKITNQPGPYFVKLSTTISFNSSARAGLVDSAIVTISDDAGNEEELTYTQNGLFQTSALQGVVGRTYFLNIEFAGSTYSSQSTILPISNIDTLVSNFEEATILFEEGYYVTMVAAASRPNMTNYYRWKVYENDSLYNSSNDILIGSDEYFAGNLEFQFSYPFALNDTVKIEMYSMNRDAIDYYMGFIEVLQSDGGLFSPPPVNAPTNISNGALGLFEASSISSRELIITQ